jgi:acyl dehydratase
MGSPGVEEICYFIPVRAGDSLTMRLEVVGLRRSPVRADIGGRRAARAFRTQTGLCQDSNQSLFVSRNRAGKRFDARDRDGFFGDAG